MLLSLRGSLEPVPLSRYRKQLSNQKIYLTAHEAEVSGVIHPNINSVDSSIAWEAENSVPLTVGVHIEAVTCGI